MQHNNTDSKCLQNLIFIGAFSLLLSFSLCSQAELVKWVDAQGNTHYGDKAPAGVSQKKIDRSTISTVNSSQATQSARSMNEVFSARREQVAKDKEKKQKDQENKQRRSAACNSMKSRLAIYQQKIRVFQTLPNGERNYVDDEQRSKTIAQLTENINRNCK